MSEKLKKNLCRILIALGIFVVILILEKTGKFPEVFENKLGACAVYLIPYLIAGYDVVKKAVLGVIHGQMLDESFLMTLASVGAFVTGEAEEAAAVMLFYQVGEFFQSYAVGKSRQSITDLMNIAPEYANVVRDDGSIETIDPDDVEIGDILVIKPGEKIPVDSVVVSGSSMINTAALTGESVPRSAGEGDPVISGCINGEGLLRVRAEKCYDDSTVARILELVENASEKKSRTEAFITRFAHWYTPLVVGAALALAVIPSLITGEWMTWIYRACTFLVISCPCALVISVPLAFFGGIGAASKHGVLVKGSNYLELMAQIGTVVTDKTGTLTEGSFKVSSLVPAEGVTEEELLLAAAAAEGLSTHPIAQSIREACTAAIPDREALPCAESVQTVSGRGIIASMEGSTIIVGNEQLLTDNGISFSKAENAAATICYAAKDGKYLGAILIRDLVKKDTAAAVKAMKEAGVGRFVMLTGDRKAVADAVAKETGIDEVHAELLPEDKVSITKKLMAESEPGRKVAFVGDGINDAPVLVAADLGIAMGGMGSAAAVEAADVVLMNDKPTDISLAVRIARKTMSIVKQNIWFSIGVKVIVLILSALGYSNMILASFADTGVCLLAILNSMRALRIK